MIEDRDAFVKFLIEAKQNTYAASGQPAASSRPASHDLHYEQGDYLYIDTYLGGIDFAGQEAVWIKGQPQWSMNYYGWMLVDEVPAGFSECLKAALLKVPPQAPFRGPEIFHQAGFDYRCRWSGSLWHFDGREQIFHGPTKIYELLFHGGKIE